MHQCCWLGVRKDIQSILLWQFAEILLTTFRNLSFTNGNHEIHVC